MHRVLDPKRGNQISAGLCALAIMTKAPRAGAVKTRLQPPLTSAEAAKLNICFLRDIGATISEAGEHSKGVGVFTPARSEKEYADILPPDFDLLPQRGDGFGERLINAAADLLQVGFESCCLINSDSPTATVEAFREAVAQLQGADNRIVLGPSDDGGYFLIGMRKLHRRLFQEIDWSTERVFAQTVEHASEIGLEVHVLPSCFDVDDRVTLQRLCDELLGENLAAAPATKKFLADTIAGEGRERIWPVVAAVVPTAESTRKGDWHKRRYHGMRRALVTGGAGLIGSHVADLLVREGWRVRILDNLEPNTHKRGQPTWINPKAEFVQGDLRDRATMEDALSDSDVVFHQAAYGGYMPEMAKYVHVNSLGTAQMLEVIRESNFPIKKVIVASSQAVYSEGAGDCPKHGLVFPKVRPVEQLQRGDWSVRCPICNEPTTSVPTPEHAPVGGETVYGLTKVDQEKLVLLWGKQVGIPTVALRYSCTYGPRQSIFNPYTGVIAIFCTRLLNNLPPVLYEDGEQTRDFSFVEDIARANLLAATTDALDGLPVNVGSGKGVTVREIAQRVCDALGITIAPQMNGEFRPGEMRHLISGTDTIRAAGYVPQIDLGEGLSRYLDWIRSQSDVRDYFSEAAEILRDKGIVHRVRT